MSLRDKLKQKHEKADKQQKEYKIEGNIYCIPGKEKEFMIQLKTNFENMMPLIKAAKNAGLIEGLRNISYNLNK